MGQVVCECAWYERNGHVLLYTSIPVLMFPYGLSCAADALTRGLHAAEQVDWEMGKKICCSPAANQAVCSPSQKGG
jgi:hypothetical protein